MQQPPPPPSDLPPTGDQRGEDLYTSATADLSAGGVAMAREAAEQQEQLPGGSAGQVPSSTTAPISDPTPAQIYAREDMVSQTERPTFVTDYSGADAGEPSPARRIDPTWAIAGGGLLALGGGVAGAWAYSRWQAERNRPINRLRRRARGLAGSLADVVSDRFEDVSDRWPDVDDMRDTAPMGGGALGALILGLVLARALHLGGWGQPQRTPSVEDLRAARRAGWRDQLRGLQDIDVQTARKKLRGVDVTAARKRMPNVDVTAARSRARSVSPRPMGLGLGGVLGVGAVGFLLWRLLRGGGHDQRDWYYGDERREQVPNQ